MPEPIEAERGNGPLSAAFGFAAFLAFLLLAVQTLIGLYATSVVTAVASDAARRVATAGGSPTSAAGAEAEARRLLGRSGAAARFDWLPLGPDTEQVVLRIRVPRPRVLVGSAGSSDIDRTVRVRIERFVAR